MRPFALSVACVALGGCALYQPFVEDALGMRPPDGFFEAEPPVGTFKLPVTGCTSGQREGFYGVTLQLGGGAEEVRLVRAPVGPMLVAVRGADGDFRELRCSAVKGRLGATGVRVNKVSVLDGEAQFVCEGLRGAVRFSCG